MIVPDVKDWTWVLERPCADCGLDSAAVPPQDVAGAVRRDAPVWAGQVLGRPDVAVRPAPQTWSPLEYACHVRDVCRLFDERLALMLTQDDPLFANWDQDETAEELRYAEQDPAALRPALRAAADAVASRLEGITGEQWQRPGRRSNGSRFTVASLAQYVLHDVVHHLYDVTGRRAG
jgi:hypothetical protein